MRNTSSKIFLLMAILSMLFFSRSIAQTNFYVNASTGIDASGRGSSTNPWKTIKYAVTNSSGSGIVINVSSGTYAENVLIGKTLTLQGAGITTVISPASGVGISIAAGNVSISNLKVANASSAGIASSGSISSLSLANVTCDGDSVGAQLSNVNGLSVNGCVFSNSTGDGFYAAPAANFTFNNCTATANGKPAGSGFLLRDLTGTSTLTNITANHNKTHGLDIRSGSSNITVNGGDFEYNGTTNLSDGGGISLFSLSRTVSNITLNGPITSSNNITAGVYIDAHTTSSDNITGLTIGQSGGTVSFSSNGTSKGTGILLWGNVSNVTVTANFSKGTVSNSTGLIIVGQNSSGALSPQNITILNSVFQVGYGELTPAISLADAQSPTYIDINNVTATSNTFLGASSLSAIDDSLIYDKLDNSALGRVNQTDNRISFGVAGISAQPQIIDFGSVKLGLHKDTAVTIQNTGTAALSIPTITLTNNVFTANQVVGTIPAGQSFSDSLHFSPNRFGSFSDTLVLNNNSPTPTLKIPVSGNSPYPVCASLESFIAYGNVARSTTKKDTLKLVNSSINTLTVDSIYTNTSFFAVDRISGTVGTDTMKVVVSFSPNSFGTFIDTVKVVSDGGTVKVALSGASPVPVLTSLKTSIAYGNVAMNTTKMDTIKLINSSISTLLLNSIYTKTNAFAVNCADGTVGTDTLKIAVSFTPTAIANYIDTVYLSNNSATPMVKIPLSGFSPAPTILCNTKAISFNDVGMYDSAKMIIKVANSSVNILVIDSIYTHSAIFTSSPSFDQATNVDTATIAVQFKPVKFGTFSDTLFLHNNSYTSLLMIPISGSTPASLISITPSSIAFGTVQKNTTSELLFTITNSSISVLQVDSLWTQTKYFNVPRMLASGQVRKGDTTGVTVRFTPDSVRSYVDTMFIANNSPVSPFKVPLSGNGKTAGVMQYGNEIPKAYSLFQNYPNPFNPSTNIQYGLPVRSTVRLIIYNILGQVVKELINSEQQAGYQSLVWNATVASGIYFYRIEAISIENPSKCFIQTKKMLLLK